APSSFKMEMSKVGYFLLTLEDRRQKTECIELEQKWQTKKKIDLQSRTHLNRICILIYQTRKLVRFVIRVETKGMNNASYQSPVKFYIAVLKAILKASKGKALLPLRS